MGAYLRGTPIERFQFHVEVQDDGCWRWTASTRASDGYGQFNAGSGRIVLAHRWSYENFNGPIPDRLEVDHRCRFRGCVNPEHLRLATKKQNQENLAEYRNGRHRGVFQAPSGRWSARFVHNAKRITVGTFDTQEEAVSAVKAARIAAYTHNDDDRVTS